MHWIISSILGAFFQNTRSSIQKKLNKEMSLMASTYTRFVFSAPIVIVVFFFNFKNVDIIFISANNFQFLSYVILGSIFQILFTFLFLYLFKFTNFLVGTTLSKTEVLQIALFEYLILKEYLSTWVIIGIIISSIGVIIFSTTNVKNIFRNFFSKSTIIGISCGTLLALSIVFFRGSINLLDAENTNFDKTLIAILFSTIFQTLIITLYLLLYEKNQFLIIKKNIGLSFLSGLSGFLATIFWFYSFSIVQAAFVRAVGQIELLFSYLSSRFLFKEKIKFIEIMGILIFITGVFLIIFYK
ncbi:MAG: EamA family transporter [Pelagibacteraceae bacterium]